jgi:hypothetical protein
MMQLDKLVLFNAEGDTRPIEFRPGALNVITGDSRTGKSSLINIVRFLMGGGKPNVPFGPIQQTVAWYALHAHVGETHVFIARKAPEGDFESNDAMVVVGDVPTPSLDELEHNTSRAALRDYLGGLLGIEDNRNQPRLGQTRHALSASFVHSLFYCFQGQGEIANPEILFHRQNREWMPQTIRDTLPYFLGAQGADDLRRREELLERRRDLRRLTQRLRAAQAERSAGLDRAGALLAECVDVGLSSDRPNVADLASARRELRRILDNPAATAEAVESGGEFDKLRDRRRELSDQVREFGEQLRALEQFADADHNHVTELAEQQARLESIRLVPAAEADGTCALCGRSLGDDGESRGAIERALGRAERRLELARRVTPRIDEARSELLDRQRTARDEIRDLNQALSALATRDELVHRARDEINVHSYVRGRIALYLDSSEDTGDEELERLQREVAQAEEAVASLAEALDSDAVRSRTTSLLRTVSRQMTTWAQQLDLEHAADGVLIDLDELTVVADTPDGPAYMNSGGIGSGMNWVGYHLTSYLALQRFFIQQGRPVPSFVVLDQPSQAFFPRDRESGGDLEELTDTDRENTRRLYKLTFDAVQDLGGALQIIALDHADFDEDWFARSVVQRWRGGEALIPSEWLSESSLGTT